jgi:hypothetical protein
VKADLYGIAGCESVTYEEFDWCDRIGGTKRQLQGLGIGVGVAYPGEPGGPRRTLATFDPRGFRVSVRPGFDGPGRFLAYLTFPNWPAAPSVQGPWERFAEGVKRRESLRIDEYVGTEADLAAAKLVEVDQLPGKPGMRKTTVRIRADRPPINEAPTSNEAPSSPLTGAKWIYLTAAGLFRVSIFVTGDVLERRTAIWRAARNAWLSHVRSLPRPRRLGPSSQAAWPGVHAISSRPEHAASRLQLVWSRPEL